MKSNPSVKRILRMICDLMDTFLFSVLLSLPLMLFLRRKAGRPVLIVTSAALIAAVFLLRILIRRRRRREEIAAKERKLQTERIVLMSDAEIGSILGEKHFRLIRTQTPQPYDLLDAVRTGAKTIGLLAPCREGKETLFRHADRIHLIEYPELIEKLYPDASQDTGRNRPFSRIRVNKYFLLGCVLFCLSFFLRYKIYYRLISCVCLIISPFAGILDRKAGRNYLRIFLDKGCD